MKRGKNSKGNQHHRPVKSPLKSGTAASPKAAKIKKIGKIRNFEKTTMKAAAKSNSQITGFKKKLAAKLLKPANLKKTILNENASKAFKKKKLSLVSPSRFMSADRKDARARVQKQTNAIRFNPE
jgi:hypothetical protein